MGWVVRASLSVITVVPSVRPQKLGATLKSHIFNMWLLVPQEKNMQKKLYWQRRKMLKCTPDSLGGRWGIWHKWGNSLLFSGGSQGVARFTRIRSAPLKGYGFALACADNAELIYVKANSTKTIKQVFAQTPPELQSPTNTPVGISKETVKKKNDGRSHFRDKGADGRWPMSKHSVETLKTQCIIYVWEGLHG